METLPDYLKPGLKLLSVGLNPSLPSVRFGFYFANPRNRFWPAMRASGLLANGDLTGLDAQWSVFERGIGFTDMVKRPSANGSDLKARDFRHGAPLLAAKILETQPQIVWFHGMVAYKKYLAVMQSGPKAVDWGLQNRPIGVSRVFVTPNPSPANAAFSLAAITRWYEQLRTVSRL